MGPIGTTLESKQHICCKTVCLVLVVTANRTVNVLVLLGVQIRNIHNFDETWGGGPRGRFPFRRFPYRRVPFRRGTCR